jgi:hypothetical protein
MRARLLAKNGEVFSNDRDITANGEGEYPDILMLGSRMFVFKRYVPAEGEEPERMEYQDGTLYVLPS